MAPMLGVCLLGWVLGLFAGGIVSAARLYAVSGWTATWIEIGTWGPALRPQPVRPAQDQQARS